MLRLEKASLEAPLRGDRARSSRRKSLFSLSLRGWFKKRRERCPRESKMKEGLPTP